MKQSRLTELVEAAATEFEVPGAAVGVLLDGEENVASHGVTNVEHPLPVDERTLFHIASVTKTFTATAIMRLVAEGRVELDAPVRRYLPDLPLSDESVADRITVARVLNHTAGLDWNLPVPTGQDESLADFVARTGELEMIAAPGERSSYSQAGYNLLGRLIEQVTGQSFEVAMTTLVLEPAGLTNTFFDLDEVLVRRFAVGHNPDQDGRMVPARPWRAWRATHRGNLPGGGIVSSASDLLRWARFHLDTRNAVLPAEILTSMRAETVSLRASSLGDAIGICWFLRDVDGVRTAGHGGSGNGQFAELLLVPERGFAVVSLSNAGPDGYPFNQAIVRRTLEHWLGVLDRDPEPLPYDPVRAREVVGHYENDVMRAIVAEDGARVTFAVDIKPEVRESSDTEMPPGYPAAELGFLPEREDEYIITEGGLQGQRGYFSRDDSGVIVGIDLGGRLFGRASDA